MRASLKGRKSPCGMQGKNHSLETKNKMSAAHTGKLRSAETKAKISKTHIERGRGKIRGELAKERWNKLTPAQQDEHLRRLRSFVRQKETKLECAVREILEVMNIDFIPQEPFNRYSVDFFIPSLNMAIECDGACWHSRPDVRATDQRKDAYLNSIGIAVVRLFKDEIKKDCDGAVRKILNGR